MLPFFVSAWSARDLTLVFYHSALLQQLVCLSRSLFCFRCFSPGFLFLSQYRLEQHYRDCSGVLLSFPLSIHLLLIFSFSPSRQFVFSLLHATAYAFRSWFFVQLLVFDTQRVCSDVLLSRIPKGCFFQFTSLFVLPLRFVIQNSFLEISFCAHTSAAKHSSG